MSKLEDKSNSSNLIKPLAVPFRSKAELYISAEKTQKAYEIQKQKIRKEYPSFGRF